MKKIQKYPEINLSQKDIISTQGFSTTLELIKIAQDTGT